MNIVFHRYNSICEPDYIRAFERLGITVVEEQSASGCGLTLEQRMEALGRVILGNKPLFVFSINFFPYISMICEKLGVLYVAVSVDCPVVEIFNRQICNSCNRVFLFDHHQYASVADLAPGRVFHLPLGADADRITETLDRELGADWAEQPAPAKYKYDISLVGSLYNEKDPWRKIAGNLSEGDRGYFEGMMSAQKQLPGQGLIEEMMTPELAEKLKAADPTFYPSDLSLGDVSGFVAVNDYLSPHITSMERVGLLNLLAAHFDTHLFTQSDTSELRNVHVHGSVSSLVEMPKVFRQSKINLNPTLRSIQTGLPQRIWDILASGGFLLTNYQAEIPEYLEIGKHLEAYENRQELLEKAAYYLEHEEEREAIAAAGCELVRQQATVVHRVTEMIRVITEDGE
jgi:spore maturation protein CgeB